MFSRTQQILAGLLVVQLLIAAVVFWPRSLAGAGGAVLIDDLDVNSVVELSILGGDGQSVIFALDGDEWILADSGYPAFDREVIDLIEKLAVVDSARLVTQTESSHRRLQVAEDDFQREVKLRLTDDTTRTLIIGNAPDAQSVYVRIPNQAETYLSSALTLRDVDLAKAGWIDPLYFTLQQDALSRVLIENGNGQFELVNTASDGGGEWDFPALGGDETLNEAGINTLIGRISSMRMTAPLGQSEQVSYGLGNPAAVVSVETPGGLSTLVIGPANEAGEHVVKWSGSPYYVSVSAIAADPFTTADRGNFAVPPAGNADG